MRRGVRARSAVVEAQSGKREIVGAIPFWNRETDVFATLLSKFKLQPIAWTPEFRDSTISF
jgi:hypothetical protein